MKSIPAATMSQYSGPFMNRSPFNISGVRSSCVAFSGKPIHSSPKPPSNPPTPEVALMAKVRMENTTPSARRPVRYSCSSATSTSCESMTMGTTGITSKAIASGPKSAGTSQADSLAGNQSSILSTCGKPTSVATNIEPYTTVIFLSSQAVRSLASGMAINAPGRKANREMESASVESA